MQQPPLRRRLLGEALRQYREQLGLTVWDAARTIGCDASKISRIETGQRGVRTEELVTLLDEYGASDAQQDLLFTIVGDQHPVPRHRWWQEVVGVLPSSFLEYARVEDLASGIRIYGATLIPPLLQTRAYARAIASADMHMPDELVPTLADAAVARQAHILEARSADLEVVIAETVLHRQVGDDQIMRAQLERLVEIADTRSYPRVTLKILPDAQGATALGDSGACSILRFKDLPSVGLVHVAGPKGGHSFEERKTVAAYTAAFTATQVSALSHPESHALLIELADNSKQGA